MAVKMHGMRLTELVLNNKADGTVGPEVVDIPLGVVGVREVALICEDEDGVALGGQC